MPPSRPVVLGKSPDTKAIIAALLKGIREGKSDAELYPQRIALQTMHKEDWNAFTHESNRHNLANFRISTEADTTPNVFFPRFKVDQSRGAGRCSLCQRVSLPALILKACNIQIPAHTDAATVSRNMSVSQLLSKIAVPSIFSKDVLCCACACYVPHPGTASGLRFGALPLVQVRHNLDEFIKTLNGVFGADITFSKVKWKDYMNEIADEWTLKDDDTEGERLFKTALGWVGEGLQDAVE